MLSDNHKREVLELCLAKLSVISNFKDLIDYNSTINQMIDIDKTIKNLAKQELYLHLQEGELKH